MRNPVLPNAAVIGDRRGFPIYASNPSVPPESEIKKGRRTRIGDDLKGLVLDNGNGEILGHGGAIVYEWEEVDKERFVKLYLAGLKQAAGLTKAGMLVFELVYYELQGRAGQDVVPLDVMSSGLKRTTYYDGLKELLEKGFLFSSTNPGLFYVNIRFMFNGDRLAFVKGYKIKGTDKQGELPLEERLPAIPASADSPT